MNGDKAFWITVFFAGLYHLLTRESATSQSSPETVGEEDILWA
jgi:hypothetical protein